MRQNVAFDIHIPTRVLSSCSQRAGPGTIGTLHVADVGKRWSRWVHRIGKDLGRAPGSPPPGAEAAPGKLSRPCSRWQRGRQGL